jgi:hypothetical protein
MYGDLRGLFSARDASSLRWSGRNCWIASTKARKSPLPLREQIKGSVEVSKAGRGSQQRCGCLGLTDSPCNYLHVCSSAYGRLVFVPVCRSANSSTTGTTRRLSSRSRNSGPSLRWTWSSLWMDAAGSSEPRRCKTLRRASAKSVSTQIFSVDLSVMKCLLARFCRFFMCLSASSHLRMNMHPISASI